MESANQVIIIRLKKRFDALGGNWVEEFKNVLSAIRITPKKAIRVMPFCLVYSYEAVAPTEIVVASYQVKVFR